ncbi:MAG: hypothetical protein ACKOL0_06665, partial [Solirubrobacterales bacterium]
MAKVKIPPVLRQHTGDQSEVELEGATVGAVLEALVSQHPEHTVRRAAGCELRWRWCRIEAPVAGA